MFLQHEMIMPVEEYFGLKEVFINLSCLIFQGFVRVEVLYHLHDIDFNERGRALCDVFNGSL